MLLRRTYLAYEELKRECVGKDPEQCRILVEEYKKRINLMLQQENYVPIRKGPSESEGKK